MDSQDSVRGQLKELNRLYKEGSELYYATAAELGLSPSALMILYGLCHVGRPCTQKELCDTWYLKKQTLHSALLQLVRSGDVRLEPLPDHARVKLIVLTEKGKALCERTAVPFLAGEERAFARLAPEERKMLLELTRKHASFIREEARAMLENDCDGLGGCGDGCCRHAAGGS